MGAIPDLNEPVHFAGVNLNFLGTVTHLGKPALVGCTVDWFDISELEIRQFTEPLALQDGIDVGGTWLGARRLSMRGTVFDKTRGETYDRLATLEPIFIPASGTFGYTPLTWYTSSGVDSTHELKTIDVRPHGLRYAITRDEQGGEDNDPLAIRWAVTFYAKRPAIL